MEPSEVLAISRAQALGILPVSSFPEQPPYLKLLLFYVDECPSEFICPISLEIMLDPVITADGHQYDRLSIEDWFRAAQPPVLSPLTVLPLDNLSLIPDQSLQTLINLWCACREEG